MMKITSTTNPRIKNIMRLKHRKNRDLSNLTVIDGVREVMRAKDAGVLLKEIYACSEILERHGGQEVLDTINSWNVPVYEVKKDVFAKICFGDRKEGVVAVCQPPKKKLAGLSLGKSPFVVVVENVEKPGNLGAILRTCDGAGVDALLVADAATDIFNPNVIRASIGAVFSVPVVQGTNIQIFEFLKERNIKIFAASPQGQRAYWNTDCKGPAAVVLGSEQKGLSDFWMDAADVQITIPMMGKADSLNVSNTAAILIYEALRQRR